MLARRRFRHVTLTLAVSAEASAYLDRLAEEDGGDWASGLSLYLHRAGRGMLAQQRRRPASKGGPASGGPHLHIVH